MTKKAESKKASTEGKESKESKGKKSNYDETLDVVLAEVEIDEQHVVQVRQYNGGDKKVGMFVIGKKMVVAVNRVPVALGKVYGEALAALAEKGAFDADE